MDGGGGGRGGGGGGRGAAFLAPPGPRLSSRDDDGDEEATANRALESSEEASLVAPPDPSSFWSLARSFSCDRAALIRFEMVDDAEMVDTSDTTEAADDEFDDAVARGWLPRPLLSLLSCPLESPPVPTCLILTA